MTNRERFHAVMNGDSDVDRSPVLEWAHWWDKTTSLWENEGLPTGLDRQELYDYFELDRNIQFWFANYTKDFPYKSEHSATYITDENDYNNFKKYLYPHNAVASVIDSIEDAIPQHESGQSIVWYTLEGFFWYPRQLFGIEPHLYSFYDYPELYHRICEDMLEWQLRVIEQFSKHIKADFMTFAEDMSYNNGPMVSEDIFEEFIAPYYKRLIPEIKKYGTRVFVDTDGDVTKLIDWLVRAGVEGILPLERQAGVDITKLQNNHPDFIWLGGFDKMCLFKDETAIDAEFERLLPVFRKGKFIPSVDHQTPPGVSLKNYKYYVKKFKEISTQACNDA